MSQPDPLAGLREQIRLATEAAERLLADVRRAPDPSRPPTAARPPTSARDTPPAGWQQAEDPGAPADVAALARLLDLLRDALPTELQQQVTDLLRQLLLLLGALIDWAAARLEQDCPGREVPIEDIPIA